MGGWRRVTRIVRNYGHAPPGDDTVVSLLTVIYSSRHLTIAFRVVPCSRNDCEVVLWDFSCRAIVVIYLWLRYMYQPC